MGRGNTYTRDKRRVREGESRLKFSGRECNRGGGGSSSKGYLS